MDYKKSIYNNIRRVGIKRFEIYNSFSKARIIVDDEDFLDNLLSSKKDSENNEILTSLIENGFIVNQATDEINQLKYIYNKRFFSSNELGLILLPTMKCNFSCPYCFEKEQYKGEENSDYFDIVEKFVRKYADNYNVINFSFFGGEPLLSKKAILTFIDNMKGLSTSLHFKYVSTLVTNGSLIDEDVLSSLSSFNCKLLQITLDGPKSQHDSTRCFQNGNPSFDLLIDKISFIADYIMKTGSTITLLVRFNLNNTSSEQVSEVLSLIDITKRGVISLMFRTVFSTNHYRQTNTTKNEEIEQYNALGSSLGYRIYKNQRPFSSCEACSDWNFMHILPDLSLWKCVVAMNEETSCIGRINEDGTLLLNSSKILDWYKAADFFNDEKCSGCSMAPDCMGGCIAYKINTGKRKCGAAFSLASAYKY